jgi:hypothetical protein
MRVGVQIQMVPLQEVQFFLQVYGNWMRMDLELCQGVTFMDVVPGQVTLAPSAFAVSHFFHNPSVATA